MDTSSLSLSVYLPITTALNWPTAVCARRAAELWPLYVEAKLSSLCHGISTIRAGRESRHSSPSQQRSCAPVGLVAEWSIVTRCQNVANIFSECELWGSNR